MLEGALHRPFLRTFRGVGIFSVARQASCVCAAASALALQLARTSVLHAKEALVLRDSIHGIVVEEAAWRPAWPVTHRVPWSHCEHEEIRPRGGGKKRTRNEFG